MLQLKGKEVSKQGIIDLMGDDNNLPIRVARIMLDKGADVIVESNVDLTVVNTNVTPVDEGLACVFRYAHSSAIWHTIPSATVSDKERVLEIAGVEFCKAEKENYWLNPVEPRSLVIDKDRNGNWCYGLEYFHSARAASVRNICSEEFVDFMKARVTAYDGIIAMTVKDSKVDSKAMDITTTLYPTLAFAELNLYAFNSELTDINGELMEDIAHLLAQYTRNGPFGSTVFIWKSEDGTFSYAVYAGVKEAKPDTEE